MGEPTTLKATELEWHVAEAPDDNTATGFSIKDSEDRRVCDFDECFEFDRKDLRGIALLIAQTPAMLKLLDDIARSGKLSLAQYTKLKAIKKRIRGEK